MGVWLFLGLWMAAILFTSSVAAPPEAAGAGFGFLKAKAGHVFVYGVLGWTLAAALTSPRAGFGLGSRTALAATVAGAALFATFDETRQSFVYGRTALPADVALDTLSALAGALLHQRRRGGLDDRPPRLSCPGRAPRQRANLTKLTGRGLVAYRDRHARP